MSTQYGAALLGRMIFSLVGGLAFGSLVGAAILRAAIGFHNILSGSKGSPDSVEEPCFQKALFISFVTLILQFGFSLVVELLASNSGARYDNFGNRDSSPSVAIVITLILVAFAVSVVLLASMLPTTFGRAVKIASFQTLLIVLVIVTVSVIHFGIVSSWTQ